MSLGRCKSFSARRLTVIWLNSNLGDLAVVCEECISLASVVAKDRCSFELNIEGTSEVACRVTEEPNAGALICIEGFGPSLHDERIVDGDDEDFAGGLELV